MVKKLLFLIVPFFLLLMYIVGFVVIAVMIAFVFVWDNESSVINALKNCFKEGLREFWIMLKSPTMKTWNSISSQEP